MTIGNGLNGRQEAALAEVLHSEGINDVTIDAILRDLRQKLGTPAQRNITVTQNSGVIEAGAEVTGLVARDIY